MCVLFKLYSKVKKRSLISPHLPQVFELKVLSALALRRLRIPRAELEAHIGTIYTIEAHVGTIEAHIGTIYTIEAHKEARIGIIEAHIGTIYTIEAHIGTIYTLYRSTL